MGRSHTDDGMRSAKGDVEHCPERCVAQRHCVTTDMSTMVIVLQYRKVGSHEMPTSHNANRDTRSPAWDASRMRCLIRESMLQPPVRDM